MSQRVPTSKDRLAAVPWSALAAAGVLCTPALLILYLSFNSGGFYPGATGVAAAALLVGAALRVTLAARPLEGLSGPLTVCAGALALFAAWTLVSGLWSDSPARAVLEFNRALLYLLLVVLVGSVARSEARAHTLFGGLALAIGAVCLAGFLGRTLPETFPVALGWLPSRLAHPLDYWNGLGILASLGIICCLHLSTGSRGPAALRVCGAAALPVVVATLLLTYSRGAIAAAVVGAGVYLIACRTRRLVTALPVALLTGGVAAVAAYQADLLGTDDPTSVAAREQGGRLALWVLGAAVAAAVLRLILVPLDRRLDAIRVRPGRRRGLVAALGGVGAVVLVAAAVAIDLPSAVADRYDRFVEDRSAPGERQRDRLDEVGNNGRLDEWRIAAETFEAEPLKGTGAGTYALAWAERRPEPRQVLDAHSLYLEVLSELGVVGGLLLLAALAAVLVRALLLTRGTWRPVGAAVSAIAVAWGLHAAVDWDWELAAVSVPVFAVGGFALARERGSGAGWVPGVRSRVVIALACLLLAITPALVAVSQSKLNDSVEAFRAGDCARSIDAALGSARAARFRPEPFQILSFCDVRLGLDRLALRSAEHAAQVDPRSWEFRYSLALVRGATGRDPRPALRVAQRLNPREPVVRRAVRAFATSDSRKWKRRARSAPLPFQR